MTDTATKILDTAQDLIQTRGYTAMSFQEIAEQVGIRKPSVIHHFPNKAALGVAVIQRYRETFASLLNATVADPNETAWEALEIYFSPYLAFADTPNKVCLCGALAGEILATPDEMHVELKLFMESNQDWLESLFRDGRKTGEFNFTEPPRRLARMCFSALQGALLVKRATGDMKQVKEVTQMIRSLLKS